MPAKSYLASFLYRTVRARTGLYLVALLMVIGLAAWAHSMRTAAASVTAESPLTPALKLAAGTLELEGTEQAVDAASAAKLLPLWQVLAQLEDSGTAAPQEMTAVIEGIKLNMSASQVTAIEAMSLTQYRSASASASSTQVSGTQAASAATDPMLTGGMPAGGMPMDGGGPLPGGRPQSVSSNASSAAASTSAVPAVVNQVIELLQGKVRG